MNKITLHLTDSVLGSYITIGETLIEPCQIKTITTVSNPDNEKIDTTITLTGVTIRHAVDTDEYESVIKSQYEKSRA